LNAAAPEETGTARTDSPGAIASSLGSLWLGFWLWLLPLKSQKPTKGVSFHLKPKPKAAFA
jgi:hypothetical protein